MTTALDTNVLVHLLVSSAPEHTRCRRWLENSPGPLATTHTNVAEFLRIVSHPKVFPNPLSLSQAVDGLSTFVEDFQIAVLSESEQWWQNLNELPFVIRGNHVFDVRIAMCLKHNGVGIICSMDSDFDRFPFLNRVSP